MIDVTNEAALIAQDAVFEGHRMAGNVEHIQNVFTAARFDPFPKRERPLKPKFGKLYVEGPKRANALFMEGPTAEPCPTLGHMRPQH